jgi:hypothetical protein
MLCKDIKDEILEAALSGAAPSGNAKAHISGCAACENQYESLRSTLSALDTWTTPEPSPYFDVRLGARLREVKEQEQQGWAASWLRKLGFGQLSWKPLAAATLVLIMTVGGGLYRFGIGVANPIKGNDVLAECPVVDLQTLDKNRQVLSELQDLDEDGSYNSQTTVNE